MSKKIFILSGIISAGIIAGCVLNNPINQNTLSAGKGGVVATPSGSTVKEDSNTNSKEEVKEPGTDESVDNTGGLAISWESPSEAEAQAASTKEDITYLMLTLSGEPINKVNNGKPVSQKIDKSNRGKKIDNIPVGTIGVKFEAYDKNDQVIGTVQADNVPIKAGQTNSLKLKLILKDTVIVENKKVDTGGLDVTVTIEDGKTVVTKTDSIPKEGLFIVNDPANKSK